MTIKRMDNVLIVVDDQEAVRRRGHRRGGRAHGAEIVGDMQCEDTYRLAYIRRPEGIVVALAESRAA